MATWTHSQEHETLCEKVHMWAFCVESYKFLPCGLHVYGDYYARSTTHQVRNNPPFPSLFSYITFCAALNSSLAISPQRHDVFLLGGQNDKILRGKKRRKIPEFVATDMTSLTSFCVVMKCTYLMYPRSAEPYDADVLPWRLRTDESKPSLLES